MTPLVTLPQPNANTSPELAALIRQLLQWQRELDQRQKDLDERLRELEG